MSYQSRERRKKRRAMNAPSDGKKEPKLLGDDVPWHAIYAPMHRTHALTRQTEIHQIFCPGVSARVATAVRLRIPRSGITWIDEMIRDSRITDLAERIYLQNKVHGLTLDGALEEAISLSTKIERVLSEHERKV